MATSGEHSRLVDVEAIGQLLHRFLRHLDARNWEGIAACFAANAVLLDDGRAWRDPASVVAGQNATLKTIHHAHQPLLECGASDARGIWPVEVLASDPRGGKGSATRSWTLHNVRFTRSAPGWAIAELEVLQASLPATRFAAETVSWEGGPPHDWVANATPLGATQLDDLDAIRQLKARYCRHLDRKEWTAWRGLFSDRAEFDVSIHHAGIDADEFVARVAANQRDSIAVHQVHGPELSFEAPGLARALWALNDRVRRPRGSPLPSHHSYGHYAERYRREGDTWRIEYLGLSYSAHQAAVPLVPPVPAGGEAARASAPAGEHLMPLAADQAESIRQLTAASAASMGEADWRSDLVTDDFRANSGVLSVGPTARRSAMLMLHAPEIRRHRPDTASALWATHEITASTRATGERFARLRFDYRRERGSWRISRIGDLDCTA